MAAGKESLKGALRCVQGESAAVQAHILRSGLATTWHTAASGASRRRLGIASDSIGPSSSYTSRVLPVLHCHPVF